MTDLEKEFYPLGAILSRTSEQGFTLGTIYKVIELERGAAAFYDDDGVYRKREPDHPLYSGFEWVYKP